MARRKKTRSKPKFTLPVALMAPIALVAVGTAKNAVETSPQNALAVLGRVMTGYDSRDGKFHWDGLKAGLFPILGGAMVHKLAGALGVNRALGRARVPWLRI